MSVSAAINFQPGVFWPDSGLSPASKTLREMFGKVSQDRTNAISLGWRQLLSDQALDILKKCSEEGWDGYDAHPISALSTKAALRLISTLPEGIILPQITPEPSGDLALEWNLRKDLILSIAAHGNRLIYAGIFGRDQKQHGEDIFGDELPEAIQQILARYFFRA